MRPRHRTRLAALALLLLASLLGALAGPGAAHANPGDPNPNPIDWRVYDSFTGTLGNDIPLRYGQSDHPDRDGFGLRHIQEHGVVPDHEEIQETVGAASYCVPAPDDRVVCTNTELSLIVVYATHNDARSGDGRPFGIITAYYFLPCLQAEDCPSPEPPAKVDTALTYTGPDSVENGSSATLSAKLTNEFGTPVKGRDVRIALGTGDAEQTCTGTSSEQGTATCTIETVSQPTTSSGKIPVTATFAGDSDYKPSTASAELGIKTPTKLTYTGVKHIANGTSARLAADLTDFRGDPVSGRNVEFSLGTGESEQTCSGTTSQTGEATCTISKADQPLNDSATVPVRAAFAGDSLYLGSDTSAELKLRYATGRAYGLSAQAELGSLPLLDVEPQPDTGRIRTADATTTSTPCAATYSSLLINVEKLCPEVTTTLAPGKATATSTVANAKVGLPGLPVIEVSGLTATSTAQCDKAAGSTSLTLKIAGQPVTVSTEPNSELALDGGARLIVNEQKPVEGADSSGLAVNGLRIELAGGAGEVVLAATNSAMHNCGD
ncbi:choice-of-anchor P family protein [Streptomyces sp. B-S-A8]|uniref:Choice-of-anchor P family protein n=1 Tax=Streptomyces solicavernae TaxID=3043614 RepID=A0ABT6S0H5_9ACTN|nr:choice-of-anchor P family protein [Streptomyces sp. B-S-A8]MDI3390197.1 choice-of-anchor P family protein [Streptomyces sp. B-S-A8]